MIYFTSPHFLNLELPAAKRFTVVTYKGHINHIWNTPLQVDGTPALAIIDDEGQEIIASVFNVNDHMDDIARVCAEGFEVDNNNKALPENIPIAIAPPVKVNEDGFYPGLSWGWDSINKQAVARGGYKEPLFTNGWSPHNKTYLKIFTQFLPFA